MYLKYYCINHTTAVLLLRLALHAEDPIGVRNAVNIFMFSELSLVAGLEAAMIALW